MCRGGLESREGLSYDDVVESSLGCSHPKELEGRSSCRRTSSFNLLLHLIFYVFTIVYVHVGKEKTRA